MGRAMIIICAGVLVSLGIISMSTADQGKLLTQKTATYANKISAKNAAHTAIQIAMQNMNKEEDWGKIHHDEDHAWSPTIDGADITLFVEYIEESTDYWKADKIRIISKAVLHNKIEAEVIGVYDMSPFSNLVPDFKGSMTFATNNFVPSFGGSASISGKDESEQCAELGMSDEVPEISVRDDIDEEKFSSTESEFNNLKDSPGGVEKISDLNYEPTDELIERLANSGDVTTINKNYGETLGTETDPGVFFIEEGANLNGKQKEGYGIMVVRSDATLKYDGELKVAGNFNFHGLVIFENAFDFVGRGTPTIYGSVLVGHTQEFLNNPDVEEDEKEMNVDLSGNIHLQYDCSGQSYAKMAAASAVKQNKYTRVVTYE